MRKLPTRKLLSVIIAGALFLPNQAFTLGLGEIEVNSALNQKLKADIELLSTTPEDAETIIIKLASRKEFTRAGLDRPYALNDLRFKSNTIDGAPHISVSSVSPIREPFLNFLIEVDWPNGHLLREYTVLLDPPVFMTQAASAPAASNQSSAAAEDNSFRAGSSGSRNIVPVAVPSAQISSRPAAGQTQVTSSPGSEAAVTSSFVPAPVVQQQATINQPTGAYRIKAGDTAWSLADAMRPDQSVSVEQMMIAMLRTNPESFIDENVNGLKRGYILRVPDYEQIASVNQADARALVREQAALWKQYQQSQSGGQPVSAMEAGGDTGSSANDGAPEGTDDAYLEIVSAGSGTSTISGKDPTQMTAKELRAELAFARERVETERVEKEALQGRVENLEQHVDKMKGMLSIEDNELSEMQSLNMPAEGEMPEGAVDESVETQAEDDLQTALAEEAAGAESLESEAMAEGETETDITPMEDGEVLESETEAEEQDIAADGEAEEAVFTDEAAAEQTDEGDAEMSEQADMAAEDNAIPEPPMVTQQPSDPLTNLLNNPIMLAAIAGGLALVLLVVGIFVKRRKAANVAEPVVTNAFDDLESIADEVSSDVEANSEEVVAESLAGDAEAETEFDSDATMILDSHEETLITEAEPDADVEEEARDDVIAEADVYLAYGIYQQAEDLLTQAIADNPERDDYRVKLAETHYASKNTEAFVEVASEIHKRADNDNAPAWKKVMVMGQDLCADNPLFQGSMVGGLDVSALAPAAAPEMDFDLGLDVDDGDAPTPDLDLSLDDEPLELPEIEEASAEDTSGTDETQILDEPVEELEFDLSDTGAVEEVETDSDDEFSLDIEASELDIDIDLEDTPAAETAAVEEAEESIDLGDIDIGLDLDAEEGVEGETLDVGEIDLDFGLDDTEESTADTLDALEEASAEITTDLDDEEISLDLTDDVESLDMDFGELADSEEAAPETVPETVISDDDDDDFDLSNLDDVDEISTKLDLARAYLDMGDHEGSRGILEEVISEGNDEQKKEASDLIAKLD